MTDPSDKMLDDLFALARNVTPDPDPALVMRVIAAAAPPVPVVRPTFAAQIRAMIGGWPAVGSLAAATVAGVWIGVAPPPAVENVAVALLGDTVNIGLFADDFFYETGEPVDG